MLKHEKLTQLEAELKTTGEAGATIPFLARLTARFTSALKTGATYKEEIRDAVRNSFAEFAEAFNLLLAAATEKLRAACRGRRILFVVDGADRLSQDDAHAFFIADAYQLQLLNGLFIYCAPISLSHEGGHAGQVFTHLCRMPSVKIREKHDPTPLSDYAKVMR